MTVTELLNEFDIPYKIAGEHEHVTENWVGTDCPICSPNMEHFRLGFTLSGYGCSCWVCGKQTYLVMLSELTGKSVWELAALLNRDGTDVQEYKTKPKGKLVLPNRLGPLLPAHKRYLKGRGFDPDEITKIWGIQGIGIATNLAWRLFIPITNQGKIVSWTTRSISDTGTRYINAKPEEEAVSLKEMLYGEDFVRQAVVITEGCTDAWRIGPGAVATMGVNYTREQYIRMTKYPVRVIIFDNETAAQRRAKKLSNNLSMFRGETYRVIIDAKDPGSADEKEIQKIRESFLE